MDFSMIAKFIPYIFQLFNMGNDIREALRQGGAVIDVLKAKGPGLVDFVAGAAKDLFPALSPANQVQAGAQMVFDQDAVKAIQAGLNKLQNSSLVVDGHYGQKTKDAVTAFQTAHSLTADGWAGKLTQAVLQTELAKS